MLQLGEGWLCHLASVAEDLCGIFVKKVVEGSVADKCGGILPNDQVVEVQTLSVLFHSSCFRPSTVWNSISFAVDESHKLRRWLDILVPTGPYTFDICTVYSNIYEPCQAVEVGHFFHSSYLTFFVT